MSLPNDTAPEVERLLTDVYRRMSAGEKWLRLGEMYGDARALHAAGVRLRMPTATPRQIHEAWLSLRLGPHVCGRVKEPIMSQGPDNLRALRKVLRVFTGLGIPYALGGSMASSVYGIDRYTRDADITVEPFPGKAAALAGAFGEDYYVSLPAIEQALREQSSFNILDLSTAFKVDVFIRKDRPFEHSAMSRRVEFDFPDLPGQPLTLHTAEDVVLFKLGWYQLGNEVSEQQWKDVIGVLRVQAGKLDQTYLEHWAKELALTDLLTRARNEVANLQAAAPPGPPDKPASLP
jgi:hypothetical protein